MQSLATTKKKFQNSRELKKNVTISNITCNGVMFIIWIRHYNIEVHKLKCNYGQLDMNVSNKLVYSPCYETIVSSTYPPPISYTYSTKTTPLCCICYYCKETQQIGK